MDASSHELLMTMTIALGAGTGLILLARLLDQSSIVLLLAGGILLGPEGLDWVRPDGMGNALGSIVSIAVAIILFEGGLTLDIRGYRTAPALIRRLLTAGVLTTWAGGTLAILAIFPFSFEFAVFAASMIIVTGPTVIAPLLRRIRVSPTVHHVLHWEGVLIDPIGVFLVLLSFEFIDGMSAERALTGFVARILLGVLAGLAGGFALERVLRRRIVPEDLVNSFTLAAAVVLYGLCEAVGHAFGFNEAGLLAVVVAGFTLAVLDPPGVRDIREFEATLTDLMIGFLFILLSARLEISDFRDFGLGGFLLVGFVLFVLRPLNVFVSAAGLAIPWREKAFLSWVAPRGIVAASMASLLAMKLAASGAEEEGKFLQTFVFSVICSTIVLQGTTADRLARLLGLKAPPPRGWCVAGAHALGRGIVRALRDRGVNTLLIDLNPRLVAEARAAGLPAIEADARDVSLAERPEFLGIGNILALTDNAHLNHLVCDRWARIVGEAHVFGWAPEPGREDEADSPAWQVWTLLPRPSVVSAEIVGHRTSLVPLRGSDASDGIPLFLSGPDSPPKPCRGRSRTLPPPEARTIAAENSWRLEMVRRELRLLRAMGPEGVLRIAATDMADALRKTLEAALASHPGYSLDSTLERLLARERTLPALLGHEIALPHLSLPGLPSPVCVLARLESPIPYGEEGEPVRMLVLMLGAAEDVPGNLATMAEISRLISDRRTRAALMEAEGPEDALNAVRAFLTNDAGESSESVEGV